jgi:hypothetical protein
MLEHAKKKVAEAEKEKKVAIAKKLLICGDCADVLDEIDLAGFPA